MLKVVVIILAIIGGIAILSVVGMGAMHFGMMSGMGGLSSCQASAPTASVHRHTAVAALERRLST